MNLSYYNEMPVALPGQVSDTSRYNVDGACVYNPAAGQTQSLYCGLAVTVGGVFHDGVKDIRPITAANEKPYGVAIRSHFATVNHDQEMVYLTGDGINVLTVGRVWMIADGNLSPTFGSTVYIDHATGRCTESTTADKITTTWTYAGGRTVLKGKTTSDDIHLLEVQLRQI